MSPRMSATAVATVLLLFVSMNVGQVHASRDLTETCDLGTVLNVLTGPCGLTTQVGQTLDGLLSTIAGQGKKGACCTAAEGILVNVIPAPPCCAKQSTILNLEVILGLKLTGLLNICLGVFKIPVCA
jgi:hypothetical protein